MSEPLQDRPSKTKRKQAMHALQDIGEQLVALSHEQLATIDLPEPLRDAVAQAKRITSREGKRRQMQYIGRLMREVDPEPIRAKLEAWQGLSRHEATLHHGVERWRERLMDDDPALTEFADRYPGADLQALRAVIREARKERKAGRAPRHYRELYRTLRAMIEPGSRKAGEGQGGEATSVVHRGEPPIG
jgi:ribosome-associated protein